MRERGEGQYICYILPSHVFFLHFDSFVDPPGKSNMYIFGTFRQDQVRYWSNIFSNFLYFCQAYGCYVVKIIKGNQFRTAWALFFNFAGSDLDAFCFND